jgi:hypothetical protein
MCVIIGNHGAASRGAGRREVLGPGFGFFHSMSMYRLERCCLRRFRQTEPRFRSPRRRSCSECRICVPAEIPEERLASTSYCPKSRCRTCGGLATQPKPYSPALALTLVGPAAEGPRERTSALTRPGSCRWPSCAAVPARTLGHQTGLRGGLVSWLVPHPCSLVCAASSRMASWSRSQARSTSRSSVRNSAWEHLPTFCRITDRAASNASLAIW